MLFSSVVSCLCAGCADRVAESFGELDLDGNGRLTSEETARDAGLSRHFDEVDVDDDGELSPLEYLAAVKRR